MKLSSSSLHLLLASLAASSQSLAGEVEVEAAAPTLRGQQESKQQRQRVLPPKRKTNACKINGEKVGVYVGNGSLGNGGIGDSSRKWATSLANWWLTGNRGPPGSGAGVEDTRLNSGLFGGDASYAGDAAATYVTLTVSEMEDCYDDGNLDALSLLVMPGGSAYEIQDALGANGKAAITSYLNNGGSYLGFCAGGYYGARILLEG